MDLSFLKFNKLSPEFKKISEGVGARKSCSIFGVCESLKVMLSASFNKPIVYVGSDIIQARKLQELFEDIFDDGVYLYPTVADNVVYKKAVSEDSFIERNRALCSILTGKAKVVIAVTQSLMMPIAPVSAFKDNIISIVKGQEINRNVLEQKLINSGYKRVDLVSDPGEFEVRGDILDVFDIYILLFLI